VRVLVFHGYLLRGTGSNVYNASLAAALAEQGHDVDLVCQDRDPPELARPESPGSVTVHNPDIGGLLPVFVHDRYAGFAVKTFAELTDAELDAYLEANVEAVRDLVERRGGFDAALANHLVMGPVVLARAGLRYAIKVHGSDLSYTVLPDLERFGPYAREACEGAAGILVGSGHIADRLRQAVDEPEVNAKVRLGPPGVDTELFAPMPVASRAKRLRETAVRLRAAGGGGEMPPPDSPRVHAAERPSAASPASPPGSAWDRDVARAAQALEWYAEVDAPHVIFVGKLIVSKGVDLLLAAWPLIHAANPDARLLIVGFGAAEEALTSAWAGLETGDLGPLRELAARGRGLEGGEDERLPILSAFLGDPPAGYADAARDAAGSVRFAGRLEHDEVAVPVAASEALVFPSTFPEAFGMVAAEAASAGVLPVSAAHSGAAEVSRELAAGLPEAAAGLVAFAVGEGAVGAIADRVNGWLALAEEVREASARALRETVERRWSWQEVARAVLAASAGELDELPRLAEA
jgi:glycosyltransferase involved in cell wall biosynthesis